MLEYNTNLEIFLFMPNLHRGVTSTSRAPKQDFQTGLLELYISEVCLCFPFYIAQMPRVPKQLLSLIAAC